MPSSDLIVTGNTERTAPENRAYFPALDGIRGFAFLLVFLHHYMHVEIAWVGVDVFFVLSGFLITGILVDTRERPHRARNFYVRRALRIFPLYYIVLLLLFAATPLAHWQLDWRWLAWPLYVGNWVLTVHRGGSLDPATLNLMNGWLKDANGNALVFIGHFWSLCVEEQFYLFWPWVVFFVSSRKALLWISGSIVVLWPLLRMVANHTLPQYKLSAELLAHSTIFRLDSLMMGALIALVYRSEARAALFRIANIGVWVAGIITAAVCVAVVLRPSLLHVQAFKAYLFTIGFTIIAAFSGVLIVHCLVPGKLLYKLFLNRALRWVGRISYGAYVLHDIPHMLYLDIGKAIHVPPAALGLVCTLGLAWLSFRYIETPFLNLKERFTL